MIKLEAPCPGCALFNLGEGTEELPVRPVRRCKGSRVLRFEEHQLYGAGRKKLCAQSNRPVDEADVRMVVEP